MDKAKTKLTINHSLKLFLIGLIFFSYGFPKVLAEFNDVPTSHPHYQAIHELELKKALHGFPDGNFKPENFMTRGEFLKTIFNDSGFNPTTKPTPKKYFNDVGTKNWLAPYIQKAVELNLIPTNNKKFNPNQPILKIDAIKLAFQLDGIAMPYSNDINPEDLYEDVKPEADYAYIVRAAKKYEINSDNSNNFNPLKPLTRAEASEIIYRVNSTKTAGDTLKIIDISNHEGQTTNSNETNLADSQKFQILLDVWNKIDQNYYYRDRIDKDKMLYSAIEAAVKQLNDQYTIFQEPADANELNEFLQGEFEGIGAALDLQNEQTLITAVLPGTPAETAGLKAGDIIMKINDLEIKNLKLDAILKMIRGPANSSVKINIMRNNDILEFNVTRAKISIKSVESKMVGNVGYIKINEFGEKTTNEFNQVLTTLKAQNPRGYVIDLRNNPGGYLDSAVDLLSNFIPKDKIAVSTITAKKESTIYLSKGAAEQISIPVAVLINKSTASAAEIMAGALQDHNIAKLIGTKSFGKGSVQQIFGYIDNSTLKISVAHWLTPNGKDINGVGLNPDISVELTKDDAANQRDPQLDQAVMYIQSK